MLSLSVVVATPPLDDALPDRVWRIEPLLVGARQLGPVDLVGGLGALIEEPTEPGEDRRAGVIAQGAVVALDGAVHPTLEAHAEIADDPVVQAAGGVAWTVGGSAQLGGFAVIGSDDGDLLVGAHVRAMSTLDLGR